MGIFTADIQENIQAFWEYLPTLLYAIVAFFIFIMLGYMAASAIKSGFKRADFSKTYQTFFLKIIRWIFGIIGFLVALKILGFSGVATSILAGGGVTAIILGFAFKDIGENILAGFFLAFSRPFNIGDLIRSEDLEGRVKSVELRHTHIRTANGCDIFIPSAQIFTKPLMNFTRDGLRRAEFVIGIDYENDALQAVKLLLQTIKSNNRIIDTPAPKATIASFTSGYVELGITFWINTFKQEDVLSDLKTEVMDACRSTLLKNDFTLSSNVSTALTMAPIQVDIEKNI